MQDRLPGYYSTVAKHLGPLLVFGSALLAVVWLLGKPSSAQTLREGNISAAPSPAPSTAISTCQASWNVVTSPNPGSSNNILLGIDATAADDVWAVGYKGSPFYSEQTLTEHWDCTSWTIIPSPSVGTYDHLNAVSVVSADDVWAVGHTDSIVGRHTLVEHWNGSQWSIVSSPQMGVGYTLDAIAALSSSDVWAVGNIPNGYGVTVHWDGSQWSIVPSPKVGTYSFFNGVAGVASNEVWVVGFSDNRYRVSTPTEHWDGTQWSVVPSPNAGPFSDQPWAVHALSANDVWAAGWYGSRSAGQNTLIEHWDGTQWMVTPSPNLNPDFNVLHSVFALSANDVWAAGESGAQSLIEHWDGTSWYLAPSQNVGTIYNRLTGITAISSDDIWAVGYLYSHGPNEELIEHRGHFSDVLPTDYFSTAVGYLVNRGAVSGYDDCTFRPWVSSTRGQLCKIVVLGEGWPIYTPPDPTFRDVPLGHAFYQYIETSYHQGIISGYDCGPGCLEFRPGNNVTRGQLAKIVVLAEGWSPYTPPTPTFQDVPTSHAFFQYVETAYNRGVISGYNCGLNWELIIPKNPSGACLEFRPGNNATRGQICKVAYEAINQP